MLDYLPMMLLTVPGNALLHQWCYVTNSDQSAVYRRIETGTIQPTLVLALNNYITAVVVMVDHLPMMLLTVPGQRPATPIAVRDKFRSVSCLQEDRDRNNSARTCSGIEHSLKYSSCNGGLSPHDVIDCAR